MASFCNRPIDTLCVYLRVLAVSWQGMEGAAVGIWCAHGEGCAKFPDPAVQHAVLEQGLAPIRCPSSALPPHQP